MCCVVECDLETSRIGAPYIYDISKLRVNSKRQGKGKNTSEVETEMKWGEGKKRKHTKRKMMKKAAQTQGGRISSRGWGGPTQEWRWGMELLLQRGKRG
jgi:hypothetical protein